jgi:putative transposase
MTEDRLPRAELLQKAGEGDFLRSVAEAVLQLLMEADAEGLIGVGCESACKFGSDAVLVQSEC